MNETFYKTTYTFTLLNKHKVILSLNSCIWTTKQRKTKQKKAKKISAYLSQYIERQFGFKTTVRGE